ncbi:hypothetical protein QE447_002255 [Stenotrophomonas sp. SORGH_AS282]|nr:hypothetical protein [Stenotrophomonas sp. SORGH_AS_0282]
MRSPTCQSSPSAASGSRSARAVSLASARSGVIHSTCSAGTVLPARVPGARGSGSTSACSSGPPNIASVLPLPVGVCSSPDSPAR